MSGFSDPILTGDGSLIRPAAKSPNFVTAATGWSIDKNGSAEFNDAVVRGQLIASLLATRTSGRRIVIDGTGAKFDQIQFYSGSGIETTPGSIAISGNPTNVKLIFSSPSVNGKVPSSLELTSDSVFGGFVDLHSAGDMTLDSKGFARIGSTDTETQIQSGLTGDISLASASGIVNLTQGYIARKSATWTAPTYTANWAASTTFNGVSGYGSLQFRIDAEDNVVIVGAFKAGAVVPVNPIFILPSGLRPLAAWPIFCQRNNAGAVSTATAYVSPSGNVSLFTGNGIGVAANNEYLVNGRVPLGNLL